MNASPPARQVAAFVGEVRIATGDVAEVAVTMSRLGPFEAGTPLLVFDRATGAVIDLDLRGTATDVHARYALPAPAPQRGRPALGVVAREVTLLPRHWEWLARQPGGASAALRRLVDAARQDDATALRERVDATYRFMAAMAGDRPGFEDAARALFAGSRDRVDAIAATWPPDIADELSCLLDGTVSP